MGHGNLFGKFCLFEKQIKTDKQLILAKDDKFWHFVQIDEQANKAEIQKSWIKILVQQKEKENWAILLDYCNNENIVYLMCQATRRGLYRIGNFKSEQTSANNAGKIIFVTANKDKDFVKNIEKSWQRAEIQCNMMDWMNAPSNAKKPLILAKEISRLAKEKGLKTTLYDAKAARKKGFYALLGVGQGSADEAAMLVLEYQKEKENLDKKLPQIALVGKGVTFDTGGISIKSANNMHYMKSDMGGAAAVVGTLLWASVQQWDCHLIGIVPLTENCVDAKSIKPGDVLQSYSGKTIEVIDTDAEGRLILADGLALAVKDFKPEVMIDLATLTGSCVMTLGYEAGGLFTQNETLAQQLYDAGQESGEKLWRLPLWDAYAPDIASDIADVRNFSGKPLAGAISAAKFLEVFTAKHPAWAHLDIAGVAFGDTPYGKMKNATAYGLDLLSTFLDNYLIKN
ncbi:MAG: leucyl aminopeptidase family protein [Chitinophagales bacterium]